MKIKVNLNHDSRKLVLSLILGLTAIIVIGTVFAAISGGGVFKDIKVVDCYEYEPVPESGKEIAEIKVGLIEPGESKVFHLFTKNICKSEQPASYTFENPNSDITIKLVPSTKLLASEEKFKFEVVITAVSSAVPGEKSDIGYTPTR